MTGSLQSDSSHIVAGVHSQRKHLRNCDKFRKSDVISIDAFQFSKFFRVLEFHSLQVARNWQELVTFKSVMTGLKNQSWLDWKASVIVSQVKDKRCMWQTGELATSRCHLPTHSGRIESRVFPDFWQVGELLWKPPKWLAEHRLVDNYLKREVLK